MHKRLKTMHTTADFLRKKHINRRFFVLGASTSAAVMPFLGLSASWADDGFRRFVQEFKQTALNNGLSERFYDLAFQGVDTPDQDVLQKAAYQPEFIDESWNYFDNRLNNEAIAMGQMQAQQWQKWLDTIEKRFGVPRSIVLAIWSMETNYGKVLQHRSIMRDVIRSLATLAYADPRRARYAKNQLIAAIKILQDQDIPRAQFVGSWAGALGHTQFIPTSYQAYGVDIDGDGKRDIWHSVPDALASAANLLQKNGWRTGQTWGYEVTLPEGKFPVNSISLAEWSKLGVKRANGWAFPYPERQATLKLPDGRNGPIFLVSHNFFVLKRYNNSDRYAFAVSLLADRIAGFSSLIKDWDRPFTPISLQQKQELQARLKALGYYDGEVDGKIGSGSKKAIIAFQKYNGLEPDGYPSQKVLSVITKQ